ncbi:MAG TPA: hypothetical protein VNO70_02105 [Blastocatellia bacterium]|nr:hypothetical protein [Blastocatellia bacterium]
MEKDREVRLRQQIEEIVRSRVGVLEKEISLLQREVNDSFTRLLERTDAAATMPESDTSLAQIAAEVTAQIDQATASSVRLGGDIALLRDSVVELNEQRTQAEVLNSLVARASNFAPRVVLFVVKGMTALAWAARGFEDSAGNNAVRGLSASLQSDTALKAAMDSHQTYYGSPSEQSENHLILSRFGDVQPERVLAVPLKVRGKSAALLYCDSADRGEEAINVEAIELLVSTSGIVVELVSLRARMGEAPPARQPEAAPPPRPAAPSPEPPEPAPTPAMESAPAEQMAEPAGVGGSSAYSTASLTPPEPPPPPAPEPPAQEAAPGDWQPATEAHDFFTPAPESPQPQAEGMDFQVSPPPMEAMAPSPPPVPAPLSVSDEEQKQHNDARRFARLLVSEIKLYNEQKVSDGRRNKDLYDRLKEDIDRSRQMYEKRVTPSVAAKFDYFYDELVNTLAEGDPSKLGSDHPGPSVNI